MVANVGSCIFVFEIAVPSNDGTVLSCNGLTTAYPKFFTGSIFENFSERDKNKF